MGWFKVDDQLAFHAKAVAAGNSAMGLWVRAGSWSAAQLTDGFIPAHMANVMANAMANPCDADALVMAGLWLEVDGGYQFHDWAGFQPSAAEEKARRDEIKAKRSEAGKKGAAARWQEGKPDGKTMANASEPDGKTMAPTRPDQNPSSKEEGLPREDVETLCTTLRDLMVGNGFKEPRITEAWRKEARLLLDKDGRELDKALNVMRWAQASSFWKPNIKSMGKFRDQYDTLRLQAMDEWQKGKSKVNPDAAGIDPDAILGRDYWVPGDPPEGLTVQEEIQWKKDQRAQHQAERIEQAKRRLEEQHAATA